MNRDHRVDSDTAPHLAASGGFRRAREYRPPMRLFLAVLTVTFLAETAVMYLLPHLLADPHGLAAIVTDSSILATLSAPPLWWLLAARARAAKALRGSEKHFRSLIENALDIIIGAGPDGTMRYISPSVRRTLGYEPEELVGKNPSELVHPDDLPAILAAIASSMQSLEPGPLLEIRLRHRDGSWRVAEAIGRSFLDESGAVSTVVTLRDVSERKEAEAKYRTLVEQLPAITYIDVVDEASPAGYTPIYFSPQIETMLGYSPEQFNARAELWSEMVHPEDRERALAEDAHHYATGEPMSHEYRLVARGGRVVWVHDQAVMVRDASGQQRYSHGVLLDITERKLAEEALREAEERWRSLVENAPDLIITVDSEGTILFMNHAIPGFTVGDAIGTAVYIATSGRNTTRRCGPRSSGCSRRANPRATKSPATARPAGPPGTPAEWAQSRATAR